MNIKFGSSTPLWSTEGAPAGNQAPAPTPAPTTQTPPATTDWSPYVPDAAKSTQENLEAKAAHDKTAPAGHDPNTPYKAPEPAPAPAPTQVVPPTPVLQFADLKAPDGYTIDEGMGTELVQLLTTKSSDPKALAQGLIDLQVKASKLAQEADSKQWDGVQEGWKKESEADPEIGGAKWSQTQATVKELSTRFGGPKFQEALELTGMGNHPEFARFIAKIAPFLKEAAPVVVPTPAPPATRFTSTNLYPDQGKK